MKNRGSTPILTNAVGVHPRNIHTKFEANPCSGLRGEVEKLKSSRRQQRQRRQRQRQRRRRRRRTQPDRYSHTHSLSVTKNDKMYIKIVLRFSGKLFTLLTVDPDVPIATLGTDELPLVHWLVMNIKDGNITKGLI